ncbi:hypothetical protein [Nocardia sp. bgisy134]|uniref:hypothetical protein n=1 Tax=Nocardia sp. bgisy134 TaxID=3413789 RepID=UPI003D713483
MRAELKAAISGLLAVMLTACGGSDGDKQSNPTTSTTIPFPYPPEQSFTDVAVPLDENLRAAAEFALEMRADLFSLQDEHEWDNRHSKYRSRVDPEVFVPEKEATPPGWVDTTGGNTLRVISAKDVGNDTIEVVICSYNVPGRYILKWNGKIDPPDPTIGLYGLTRPRIQWTDRPAADGSVSAGQRWLLVDDGIDLSPNAPRNLAQQVCEPFKPEPFVQKMPDPTTTIATPTR